jgi:hypothetical protein
VGLLKSFFGGGRRPPALSEEAVQRLARLGYTTEADLRSWTDLWRSERESFFWLFLRKKEEAAEEYRRWFPRLQDFAAECRRAVPAPNVDDLSTVEREQHRILLAKMLRYAESGDRCVLRQRLNRAAILYTTRVALGAAQEVFGGTGAVILQEAEWARWFSEVYPMNQEAFWWYAFAWWTLREGLAGEDEENIRRRHPLPEGGSYWVVQSGTQWGTLAGGASDELWRWDGQRAEFITGLRVMMF